MRFKRNPRKCNGYRLIYKPNYYLSYKKGASKGYIYEHIYVATKILGRNLRPDEVVHHLDMNRSNNDPSNLIILTNSDHTKLHIWIRNNINVKYKEIRYCKTCSKVLKKKMKNYCSIKCLAEDETRNKRPTEYTLRFMLAICDSMVQAGTFFKVSDNAVRKWSKYYNLSLNVKDHYLEAFFDWVTVNRDKIIKNGNNNTTPISEIIT